MAVVGDARVGVRGAAQRGDIQSPGSDVLHSFQSTTGTKHRSFVGNFRVAKVPFLRMTAGCWVIDHRPHSQPLSSLSRYSIVVIPTEGRNLLSLPRERKYYVYIMSSKSRVLYVGVTGSLLSRVLQHKAGETESFAKRYKITRL